PDLLAGIGRRTQVQLLGDPDQWHATLAADRPADCGAPQVTSRPSLGSLANSLSPSPKYCSALCKIFMASAIPASLGRAGPSCPFYNRNDRGGEGFVQYFKNLASERFASESATSAARHQEPTAAAGIRSPRKLRFDWRGDQFLQRAQPLQHRRVGVVHEDVEGVRCEVREAVR
ncbi:MAG: hypothetical protein ACI8XO_003762, partial [Verrucomicrobiales bacterium]